MFKQYLVLDSFQGTVFRSGKPKGKPMSKSLSAVLLDSLEFEDNLNFPLEGNLWWVPSWCRARNQSEA